MEACFAQLKEFDIPFEAHALSAHRTPNEVISLAESAKDRGIKVIIAAAEEQLIWEVSLLLLQHFQ